MKSSSHYWMLEGESSRPMFHIDVWMYGSFTLELSVAILTKLLNQCTLLYLSFPKKSGVCDDSRVARMYANPAYTVLIQLATPKMLNRGLEKYTEVFCPCLYMLLLNSYTTWYGLNHSLFIAVSSNPLRTYSFAYFPK